MKTRQTTIEGKQVVTVACHGSRVVPVWITTVYVAHRRTDGVLIWRFGHIEGMGSSSAGITGPMIDLARSIAKKLELDYKPGVYANKTCC